MKVNAEKRRAHILLVQSMQVLTMRARALSSATIYMILRSGQSLVINLLFLAPIPRPLVDFCAWQRQVLGNPRNVLRGPVCVALELWFKQINLFICQSPAQLSVLIVQCLSAFRVPIGLVLFSVLIWFDCGQRIPHGAIYMGFFIFFKATFVRSSFLLLPWWNFICILYLILLLGR